MTDIQKKTLKEQTKFADQSYNDVVHEAHLLFPGRVKVVVKDRTITIDDNIAVVIFVSANETKFYVHTFRCPQDIRYDMSNCNPTVRFFDPATVIDYLKIKKQENDFVRQHNG